MKALLAFVIYCALAIALTYPLILQLESVLPHDAGDPALNTWILWWNAQTIPYTTRWWNAPAFYPVPGVLAYSEHLLGLSLISTPIQKLGGSPQVAYNVVFLLTFPLSAIGAYLLAREVMKPGVTTQGGGPATQAHDAAFIGGLLFGFSPYRIAHLPQIQCLAAFPMPFALLGLHRYLRDPRPRWLMLFGMGWFLQGICNGYYLLFFSVLVGIWMFWFASPWRRPRTFFAVAFTWCLAALLLLPLLWQYQSVHEEFGFRRDFETIRSFSADIAALMYAPRTLAFWSWVAVFKRPEGELFPGLTITLLVAAGILFGSSRPLSRSVIVRRVLVVIATATGGISLIAVLTGRHEFRLFGIRVLSMANPINVLIFSLALGFGLALTSRRLRRAYSNRSALVFYAIAGLAMWLLSLGPAPTVMGRPLMVPGPYSLLMFLPGFNSLRVPARFWMMSTLCLAVVGAILFDRLARIRGTRTPPWRVIAATVVAAGVLADGWVSEMPLAAAPPDWKVEVCKGAAGPGRALVEIPLGDTHSDVAAMYRSMRHRRPVVNGYSGYFPPHYAALRFGLDGRNHDVLTQLAANGVADVVVNREKDPGGRWDKFVASHAGAQLICTEGKQSLYRLMPESPVRTTTRGSPVPVALIRPNVNGGAAPMMTDGDRTTRWESGPQTERTMVELDLGAVRHVKRIELLLGPFIADFPRGLVIESSLDGQAWREVWRGGSAGLAFVGAFEAPGDVPLKYEFPPTPARYMRLRLTASDDIYYWSIAELKVLE
jgi:hypothetical protein